MSNKDVYLEIPVNYNIMDNNDKLAGIIAANDDKIKTAVLAEHIVLGQMAGFTKEWDINGEDVIIGVAK